MLKLIQIYSLALIKKEPLKVFISFLGLVIGVAIFYAMQTSSEFVYSSFSKDLFSLSDKTAYLLESNLGEVPVNLYPKLRRTPLIQNLSPIAQNTIKLDQFEQKNINIIGIDILFLPILGGSETKYSSIAGLELEPEIYISQDLDQYLKKTASPICIGSNCFKKYQLIKNDKLHQSIIVDIALFHELFGNTNKVDGFYLSFADEKNIDQQISKIRNDLPKHLSIGKASDNSAYLERVTQAFRVNLNFLASLSLAAALILIYNTAYYICLRRHADIALFLTLGASRLKVKSLIFIEGLCFSTAASVIGMILGYYLSILTNQITASTAMGIYNAAYNMQVAFSYQTAIIALTAGIFTSQFAILKANATINKIEIKSAFSQRISHKVSNVNLKKTFIYFLLTALFCLACCKFLKQQSSPYLGFLPALTAMLSSFFLAEIIITAIAKLFKLSSNSSLIIAGAFNQEEIQRQKFTIFALSLTLSMFLAVTSMISSFRDTVENWIKQITPADLYISGSKDLTKSAKNYFSNDQILKIKEQLAPDLVDSVQSTKIVYQNLPLIIYGIDYELLKLKPRLSFARKPQNLNQLIENPNSTFISESFAKRAKLDLESEFNIAGVNSTSKLKVAGVIFDFTSEHGVIYISQKLFQDLFDNTQVENFSVYLSSKVDENFKTLDHKKKIIQSILTNKQVKIRTNTELHNEVIKIFDQTFTVTYILELSALIISALVLAISVLILLFERKNFLLIFYTIGASYRQLKMLILSELLLICLSTALLSICLGLSLALILVYFVNYYFFGWSINFSIPWQPLAYTLTSLFVISYLVGVLPISNFLKRSVK